MIITIHVGYVNRKLVSDNNDVILAIPCQSKSKLNIPVNYNIGNMSAWIEYICVSVHPSLCNGRLVDTIWPQGTCNIIIIANWGYYASGMAYLLHCPPWYVLEFIWRYQYLCPSSTSGWRMWYAMLVKRPLLLKDLYPIQCLLKEKVCLMWWSLYLALEFTIVLVLRYMY